MKKTRVQPTPVKSAPEEPIHYPICFDSSVYSTSPRNYKLWLDVLILKTKMPAWAAIPLFGFIIFAGSVLIAFSINFQAAYLTTRAIYIGLFGIVWVFGVIYYASHQFHAAYEDLRPCFLVSDEVYKAKIDTWFRRFASHRGNIIASLIFLLVAWGVVYVAFYGYDTVKLIGIQSLRPTLFSNDWYTPDHLFVKALLIGYWAFFCAFPLATSARLLVLNQFFLLSLQKLPVIPLPEIVFVRLQKITGIYVFAAVTWFVGVSLFGMMLFERLDYLAVSILFCLSLIGILTFFTPQFVYRNLLLKSNFIASQWLLCSFYDRVNIGLNEKWDTVVSKEIGRKVSSAENLLEFAKESSLSRTWIYDPTDFIWLIIGQVFTYGSVYLESWFKSIIH